MDTHPELFIHLWWGVIYGEHYVSNLNIVDCSDCCTSMLRSLQYPEIREIWETGKLEFLK